MGLFLFTHVLMTVTASGRLPPKIVFPAHHASLHDIHRLRGPLGASPWS